MRREQLKPIQGCSQMVLQQLEKNHPQYSMATYVLAILTCTAHSVCQWLWGPQGVYRVISNTSDDCMHSANAKGDAFLGHCGMFCHLMPQFCTHRKTNGDTLLQLDKKLTLQTSSGKVPLIIFYTLLTVHLGITSGR